MAKSLRTFLDDMRGAYPSEVVSISKTVNPLAYDVTAIVKQLGALKKFPGWSSSIRSTLTARLPT